jgi:hypothetical protein
MLWVVQTVRQLRGNAACTQVVLSDANSVFIEEIVEHQDLQVVLSSQRRPTRSCLLL